MSNPGNILSLSEEAKISKEFVKTVKSPKIKHLFRVNRSTQIVIPERILKADKYDREQWGKNMLSLYGFKQ